MMRVRHRRNIRNRRFMRRVIAESFEPFMLPPRE
jgi:hypothetical protein